MAVGLLSGSTMEGSQHLSTLRMLGGIITGSAKDYKALPVAGQPNTPGNTAAVAGSTAVLSSSFAGVSGSVIQALNFLKSVADSGAGDVTGPGSSTDNAIARFDGAGGKTLQNSGITIDDSNNLDAAAR